MCLARIRSPLKENSGPLTGNLRPEHPLRYFRASVDQTAPHPLTHHHLPQQNWSRTHLLQQDRRQRNSSVEAEVSFPSFITLCQLTSWGSPEYTTSLATFRPLHSFLNQTNMPPRGNPLSRRGRWSSSAHYRAHHLCSSVCTHCPLEYKADGCSDLPHSSKDRCKEDMDKAF